MILFWLAMHAHEARDCDSWARGKAEACMRAQVNNWKMDHCEWSLDDPDFSPAKREL